MKNLFAIITACAQTGTPTKKTETAGDKTKNAVKATGEALETGAKATGKALKKGAQSHPGSGYDGGSQG